MPVTQNHRLSGAHLGNQAAALLIMRLSSGALVAGALHAVLDLDLPDLLKDGAKSLKSLATSTGVSDDALRRLMMPLTSIGLFAEAGPDTFGPTAATRLLMKGPGTLRATAEWLTSPFYVTACSEVAGALRTGETIVERTKGMALFEFLEREPALATLFDQSMQELDGHRISAILALTDLSQASVVVDVGAGRGELLASLLRHNLTMNGVMFDLPSVVDRARSTFETEFGTRLRFHVGDFTQAVPPGGDVYLLKRILHDWNDEAAVRILTHVRSAIGDAPARVVIIDSLKPDAPHIDMFLDLHVMLTLGGRERTPAHFVGLLAAAGFETLATSSVDAGLTIIEAAPRSACLAQTVIVDHLSADLPEPKAHLKR